MIYYIYTLKFFSPVHFGDSANGGNLDKVSMVCSADTYFSALINEADIMESENVPGLINKFQSGDIVISSLFPYYNEDDELQFYLPKPVITAGESKTEIKNFQEMKKMATKMKKSKKSLYVRASEIEKFLSSIKYNKVFEAETPVFAVPLNTQKVNCRYDEPLPYFVGGYRFSDNTGLYFIAGFENEADIESFNLLVESLGYNGIGGKKSSGFGKYELSDDPIEISEEDYIYDDDLALAKMLKNGNFDLYMSIAPVSPAVTDIETVKKGAYKIIKRSGFVYSAASDNDVKKNDVYMIAEGSTFPSKIEGKLIQEHFEHLKHNVYRNGMGLFVGLDYE